MKHKFLTDDNGYHWCWNGWRVFCLEGETEFIEFGLDPEQNGYRATSVEEATQILIEGGYIQENRWRDEN